MRKLVKILSSMLAILMLLTTFSTNVMADQSKIKSITAENGQAVCTLTITLAKDRAVSTRDFNFTYSINREHEKSLKILSFKQSHKVVTITAPAFEATSFNQKITITEKKERESTTIYVKAKKPEYSVVYLPSPTQDITIKSDETFKFDIDDFQVKDPKGKHFKCKDEKYAVRVSKVPSSFTTSGSTMTAGVSAISPDRVDVEVEITNHNGKVVYKTLVFHTLVEVSDKYSVTYLPSSSQDITVKADEAFDFGINDFQVINPKDVLLGYEDGSFAVRISSVPSNFTMSGSTFTADTASVSTERVDVGVEITNGDGTVVFKALVFHVLVEANGPPERDPVMIKVTKKMLGESGMITGQYAPIALFDEIDSISYPPNQEGGYNPPIDQEKAVNLNTWRIGGGDASWVDPSLSVKLDREYRLTEIYFYDGEKYAPSFWPQEGSPYEVAGGKFYVYSGETKLVDYTLTNEGKWVKVSIDGGLVTDSLKFVKETGGEVYYWSNADQSWGRFGPYICDVNIAEVVLFGVPLGEDPIPEEEPEPEPEPEEQEPPDFGYTFGDTVGTNSFFNEDLKNYENINFVREYHNWVWTEAAAGEGFPQTASTLTPDVMITNRWNAFDNYYQQLKTLGIGVDICIQGGVSDTSGLSGSRPNFQGDKDSIKASSYYAHGASMFQHAARYGSNTNIDPSLVKVAPGTTKEIGLNLIKYYENWNEPNATWAAAGNQFTAAQFAAMTSADYDGHMGTMGPGVGIKNADPNAKLVMGGLVGLATDFIKNMNKWFEVNRTEEQWLETHDTLEGYVMYPFDVINVHYYCPDGTAQTGLSPEDDNLYERMSQVVSFRNRYYPKAELWLSEFGWDSNQGSPQSATVEYTNPNTGTIVNEGINKGLDGKEVQGRWLVREYLILAAAGVDRSQQFMMPDSGSGGSGRFESCGMIEMGTKERKPSWYYVGTMNYWLETTKFENELETGKDDMLAYQFKEKDTEDRAIAIWCTTSNNQVVDGYELTLPEGTNYAYVVSLEDKAKTGVVESLTITDGKVSVDVSEKPIFVLARTTKLNQTEAPKKIDLSGAAITGTVATRLMDEQNVAGDPLNDLPGTIVYNPGQESGTDISNYCWPSNSWQQFEGTLDLGAKYHITNIVMYRVEGGEAENLVTVSYNNQDSWTEAFKTSKAKWVNNGWWDSYECNFETQKIKFAIPLPGDIKIREIVIYGYPVDGDGGEGSVDEGGGREDGNNLLGINFEDLGAGSYTTAAANEKGISYYGGSAEVVVEGSNKVLKLLTTPGQQDIQFDILNCDQLLVPGKDYVLEYKFKVGDNFTMPGLMYTDLGANWTYLFNPTDSKDPLAFSSRWWGKYTFSSNVWNKMVVKFQSNTGGGYSFELILNGESLVKYDVKSTDPAGVLPYKLIRMLFNSGSTSKQSIVYLDGVYLYEVPPVNNFFSATFDNLPDGTMISGNGITVSDGNPSNATVLMPVETDPRYIGSGDKILKVTGWHDIFNIDDATMRSLIKQDTDFIVDYKVWVDELGTTPMLEAVGANWWRFAFVDTDWWGKIFLPVENDYSKGLHVELSPNMWHRIAVKLRFVSDTEIRYEAYIDDMHTPLVSTFVLPKNETTPLPTLPLISLRFGIVKDNGTGYLNNISVYRGTEIVNPD